MYSRITRLIAFKGNVRFLIDTCSTCNYQNNTFKMLQFPSVRTSSSSPVKKEVSKNGKTSNRQAKVPESDDVLKPGNK